MVLKRPSRPSESSSAATPKDPPPLWTSEAELSLFSALIQHKVAGPSKHFQMALVTEKVNQDGFKDITANQIWSHMKNLFNLPAVDEIENSATWAQSLQDDLNVDTPVEFSFPRKEFQSIVAEMRKNGKISSSSGFDSVQDTPNSSKRASNSSRDGNSGASSNINANSNALSSSKNEDTPKSSTSKRPTRSTPSSTPAKRRK
ncbi:MRG/MORF4L-binding protein-like [Tigriopus californicus]|uniref:MRG/MORF4L-binding protein-like n=1 Tax=Tigriopus californicus TaxID=6832 RepID=UPI0027DA3718|nr:MRG/MORF4L-binding protein-like [Tigriopus californicus]|eukprot:TCALIF_09128-PA protein Name:"Similar to MRGBP MRG/MORF4L-binding protein (Homo sapiens)" AED:0.36 eAED:0.36 QI:145/1/1/1/0.5/0.33/3/131/201